MPVDQETIRAALRNVKYPGYTRDIVSFGVVKQIEAKEGQVDVTVELTTTDPKVSEALKPLIVEALKPYENQAQINVHLNVKEPSVPKPSTPKAVTGIKRAIAIASGKGGVGKTTVAVNLAYALKAAGQRVGLMDCDIYGPTVPLMLGVNGEPTIADGKLLPFEAQGIKVMSMGLLIDENAPVVWRGPMITKAIQQFIADVNWGELDTLVIDLPPGTGDAQLTLVQTLTLHGAVVVTTPQQAASQVAIRGAQMFAKVGVPVLGVVENMSYLVLPDGTREYVFGQGGGEATAHALRAPLLAQLPLDSHLRENADAGRPILAVEAASASARAYKELAQKLA